MSSAQVGPHTPSAQSAQPEQSVQQNHQTRDVGHQQTEATPREKGRGRGRGHGNGRGRGRGASQAGPHAATTHFAPARLVPALTFKVSTAPNHVPHPPIVQQSANNRPVAPKQPPSQATSLSPNLPPPKPPPYVLGALRLVPGPAYTAPQPPPPQLPPLLPNQNTTRPPPPTQQVPARNAEPLQQRTNLPSSAVQISTRQQGQTSRPAIVRPSSPPSARPVPSTRTYTFSQRVQVLTLLTHQYSPAYIEFVTGVRAKAQLRMLKTAESRGYNFLKNPRILDAYVVDGLRSGRPKGSRDKSQRKKKGEASNKTADGADHSSDEEMEDGFEGTGVGIEPRPTAAAQAQENYVAEERESHTRTLQGVTSTLAGIREFLARSESTAKT